jgi:hypothetical protein
VTRSLCAITGPSAELGDIDDPGRKKGNFLEKNKRAKGTRVATLSKTYLNMRSSLEAASFSPAAHLAKQSKCGVISRPVTLTSYANLPRMWRVSLLQAVTRVRHPRVQNRTLF